MILPICYNKKVHILFPVGVETESFPYSEETNCFDVKSNLVLEGISKEHITGYMTDLLLVGTYYRRLYRFAFNQSLEDHFHSNGLVHEVRGCVRGRADGRTLSDSLSRAIRGGWDAFLPTPRSMTCRDR